MHSSPINIADTTNFHSGTKIKVIGVGGGGGNAVQYMIAQQVRGAQFLCANTDAQALLHSGAHRTIHLGHDGMGAGGIPEEGRKAALAAEAEIRAALENTHMLFIAAGMGGGTGTGAAPVIARIAREMGILTVAVVTKPFEWEGPVRQAKADEGLAELQLHVDAQIVVLNDRLHEVFGDEIALDDAFACADNVLHNAVGGLSEIITGYGFINLDFADVRTVMHIQGKAMMGTAQASGKERAREAAEKAIACPLLEGVDMASAQGVLVVISAPKGKIKLAEAKAAADAVRAYAAPGAEFMYGASHDETLGDAMRVTVLATGLRARTREQPAAALQETAILRTGTDHLAATAPAMQNAVSASAAPLWKSNRARSPLAPDGAAHNAFETYRRKHIGQ